MTCYGVMQGIEGMTGLTPHLQFKRAKVTAVLNLETIALLPRSRLEL